MFSPYHTSGFYRAPVTKGVLCGLVLSSVTFNLPLSSYRGWFDFNYTTIFEQHNVLRYIGCRSVFLDPKDLLCASILLYHFRIFERRYGSYKFANFLCASFVLSLLLELSFIFLTHKFDVPMTHQPLGPYGPVFSLLVPYFCDIPRVAVTHLLGIPVTGKSFTYIIGLQMAAGSLESFMLASCGLVAGLLYRANVCKVHSILRIPAFVSLLIDKTLGPLVTSAAPKDEVPPYGATLELQRQQHIEQLEQQLAWAQLQPRPPGGNPFGFGLFGNGDERERGEPVRPAPVPTELPEEQIERMTEMGFERDNVLRALRVANNDPGVAINILLQES
ncbi:Ubiquitin-associated domain-containing protein 2 [Lamellibrachia satsuma]|nr:Ubiquitin-associated domain-containing protein 2 [Lamellibrachia satsuma]